MEQSQNQIEPQAPVKPKKRKALKHRTRHPKGKVVRISPEVHAFLFGKLKKNESWDALLRRILGFPTRKGMPQPLIEVFLLRTTMKAYPSMARARGAAVAEAVQKGRNKAERPVRVREVV